MQRGRAGRMAGSLSQTQCCLQHPKERSSLACLRADTGFPARPAWLRHGSGMVFLPYWGHGGRAARGGDSPPARARPVPGGGTSRLLPCASPGRSRQPTSPRRCRRRRSRSNATYPCPDEPRTTGSPDGVSDAPDRARAPERPAPSAVRNRATPAPRLSPAGPAPQNAGKFVFHLAFLVLAAVSFWQRPLLRAWNSPRHTEKQMHSWTDRTCIMSFEAKDLPLA
jgi:hypothetical protein